MSIFITLFVRDGFPVTLDRLTDAINREFSRLGIIGNIEKMQLRFDTVAADIAGKLGLIYYGQIMTPGNFIHCPFIERGYLKTFEKHKTELIGNL